MTKMLSYLLFALALAACGEPDRPSISLYLALQRGDIDQIERHIHWGTDINEFDPDGRRPLHVAAATGRVVVVKLLLKHGAEVNALDKENRTALERAVLAGRTQIADLLLSQGARLEPSTLLLDAAHAGARDRDIVRWLVDHGADLEARSTDGDTPLLIAVRDNNHRLARHLIDQGADVNVRDAGGTSALELARALGHEEIAHWLRRSGAADP
ncbi:MAG: ankyrin repeat domain-containing protein [Gammaproteobacteria bacterium]|jgi:ankyrin repeat protein